MVLYPELISGLNQNVRHYTIFHISSLDLGQYLDPMYIYFSIGIAINDIFFSKADLMVGILDKFLSFFKKKKQLTLVESLTRLKKKKMDFYSPKFNQEPQSFLENNILDTIAKYKYINQFPIEQSDIQVGSISMFSYKTMNFYQWFTNNGKMIENKDKVLKEWIDESIKLVKLYEFRIKLQGMEDNKSYVNAKRIAPYYYDLERLVEKLNTLT